MLVKNGPGLLGLGTLKSAVFQEWMDETSWFLACWYKFSKAKSYFNSYWVGMVKNEGNEIYLTNDLLKWADWLKDFCMLIVMDDQSTLYLWHLNAGGPLQLYLARVLRKIPFGQKWPQNTILLYVEKFCHWFLLKTYVNNYCYCTDFDLTGRHLRFTPRFWILMTELLVIMNSFTITEIHKNNGFINGSVALK